MFEKVNHSNVFENKKEGFVFEGEKLDSIDLNPENPESDVPVMLIPGWGHTFEGYKKIIDNIYKGKENEGWEKIKGQGRRVLAVKYSRKNINKEEEFELPAQEQKARVIIDFLKSKNIKSVDIIAHSEGAINVALASLKNPELFRNLILVAPGGLEKVSFSKLSLRTILNKLSEIIGKRERGNYLPKNIEEKILSDKYSNYFQKDAKDFIGKNKPLSMKEARESTKVFLPELLFKLKELGLFISVISPVNDHTSKMEVVQRNLTEKMVDGFYSVRGKHDDLIKYPEIFSSLILSAVRALERKREK